MSNVVFLIGNGFDLNCGIKSTYKDAYHYYCNQYKINSKTIEKFKKELKNNHENWSDFEIGITKYAEKLNDEDELIECIRDFRKALKEYLLSEEERFYKKINTNDGLISVITKVTKQSIDSFQKGISNNVTRLVNDINSIQFVSFNYTSILDNFVYYYFPHNPVSLKFKSGYLHQNVIHIHGSFLNTPVLGIDRLDQINVKYELSAKGQRTLLKSTFNSEVDSDRIEKAKNAIWNARYICIFGLSLGITDLTWRENIISWLKDDSYHQLFIYDYSAYSRVDLDDDERLDIEDDLKNTLCNNWNLDKESSIINQIHMPCGNKIFNYKEAIENYIQKLNEKTNNQHTNSK